MAGLEIKDNFDQSVETDYYGHRSSSSWWMTKQDCIELGRRDEAMPYRTPGHLGKLIRLYMCGWVLTAARHTHH